MFFPVTVTIQEVDGTAIGKSYTYVCIINIVKMNVLV